MMRAISRSGISWRSSTNGGLACWGASVRDPESGGRLNGLALAAM